MRDRMVTKLFGGGMVRERNRSRKTALRGNVEVRHVASTNTLTHVGVSLLVRGSVGELEVAMLRTGQEGNEVHVLPRSTDLTLKLVSPFRSNHETDLDGLDGVVSNLRRALEYLLATRICCCEFEAQVATASGQVKLPPELVDPSRN